MHNELNDDELNKLAKKFEGSAYHQGYALHRCNNRERRFHSDLTQAAFTGYILATKGRSFIYTDGGE
jgi:hypothetical protein